ncbi:NAD(P)H-dependent oxidoreductase [Desulfovibrio inopinatus]|uniref:NAD(P)H-dependent oxidoreductase n=1 Tax=Desulfovibrio inopinatus TaxID=102109 RepID=UPI0004063EB5|nr:NAD(P)H-dependent oxidoreductase [Desulfovibrio inopinatus]
MTILLIVAHPTPGSFNHAIFERAHSTLGALGHNVLRHDLYEQGFDPLLPGPEISRSSPLPSNIETHCQDLASADGIIIVHPNWWGMPPAILTGWVDRIVRPGVAYEFLEGDSGEGVPTGLLRAQTALVFNTSNTAKNREQTVFGDPLERIWKDCIFDLCGVHCFHRRMFETIITSTLEQRHAWLDEVESTVREYFPARHSSS